MDALELLQDGRFWIFYEGEYEGETIGVFRKCPECCRFIKKGDLAMNMEGDIKLENWHCKRHGEIKPYFERMEIKLV